SSHVPRPSKARSSPPEPPPRTRFLFFSRAAAPPHLPSFPTRRSSDLNHTTAERNFAAGFDVAEVQWHRPNEREQRGVVSGELQRSEEHTSELQSLAYLVCRLLLENKNLLATHEPEPVGCATIELVWAE